MHVLLYPSWMQFVQNRRCEFSRLLPPGPVEQAACPSSFWEQTETLMRSHLHLWRPVKRPALFTASKKESYARHQPSTPGSSIWWPLWVMWWGHLLLQAFQPPGQRQRTAHIIKERVWQLERKMVQMNRETDNNSGPIQMNCVDAHKHTQSDLYLRICDHYWVVLTRYCSMYVTFLQ